MLNNNLNTFDVVYLVTWNTGISKWRNPKTAQIYDIDKRLTTESKCNIGKVFSVEVYNYDRWQSWNTIYFKRDASENSGGGQTIIVDVSEGF